MVRIEKYVSLELIPDLLYCLSVSYLEKADALIETGMRACEMGPPVPQDEMEVDMEEAIQVGFGAYDFPCNWVILPPMLS